MRHSFFGGIHPDDGKRLAAASPITALPAPDQVVIPMSMHIGAACTPTVQKGDDVRLGQVIGRSEAAVSVPIHASVSGTVTAVEPRLHPNGQTVMSVVIANDHQDRLDESVRSHAAEVEADPKRLLPLIKETGIVGMGGATFPAHVKLSSALGKVDTFIINAAECEPYITSDHRTLLEHPEEVLAGIRYILKLLELPKAVLAVEGNKQDAIEGLRAKLAGSSDVELMVLRVRYPQGAEKQLIQTVTGRQVPPGGLPADVGCIVMNVGSVAFVSRYLDTGKPLVSRTVTVSGDCIRNPMNVRVPIGTLMKDIVDFCGGFTEEPVKILSGGPMMGTAITDLNVPLLKSNNAVLAFSKKGAGLKKEYPCIHCGRCHEACPMGLIPTDIEKYALLKDAETLSKMGTMVCMECGSCAFSCPGGKPLVQYMRLAKSVIREASKK